MNSAFTIPLAKEGWTIIIIKQMLDFSNKSGQGDAGAWQTTAYLFFKVLLPKVIVLFLYFLLIKNTKCETGY